MSNRTPPRHPHSARVIASVAIRKMTSKTLERLAGTRCYYTILYSKVHKDLIFGAFLLMAFLRKAVQQYRWHGSGEAIIACVYIFWYVCSVCVCMCVRNLRVYITNCCLPECARNGFRNLIGFSLVRCMWKEGERSRGCFTEFTIEFPDCCTFFFFAVCRFMCISTRQIKNLNIFFQETLENANFSIYSSSVRVYLISIRSEEDRSLLC